MGTAQENSGLYLAGQKRRQLMVGRSGLADRKIGDNCELLH
jgi:hypothetical protein